MALAAELVLLVDGPWNLELRHAALSCSHFVAGFAELDFMLLLILLGGRGHLVGWLASYLEILLLAFDVENVQNVDGWCSLHNLTT